ncbi:ornithine carbamoyltransferase [Pseudemcibacter aquimaris]|uniref:ornithine carbamoyltransferase n=1 Tax=Pseudemcibacter aquimaris TaxID=2857064 RepID=UPI002012DBD2|nr:ornithine carbamoyltransferase [Pseudemcibacter aquimaris]MCC3860249.1 ornithine carbamoyltransferase [Pseudemcibacter aquimaris]WDU57574.1 ornithine carbamoyltransferase [Pseudemcibacter aquimaris]
MSNHNLLENHRHFLDISSITSDDAVYIIEKAKELKKASKDINISKGFTHPDAPLKNKALAMIFEKSSTRTRVSFEMAMHQLGGKSVVLQNHDMQLGRGESVSDTAQVLSGFVDAIMLRANSHDDLLEMAEYSKVPIINALTDYSHPCQIMADILTFEEHKGSIKGKKIAWCGDGNNVAVSWIHAAVKFDCELALACPDEYAPLQSVVDWANENGGKITLTTDPEVAVKDADCVITDTFVSMGDEDAKERLKTLAPYIVDSDLMVKADSDAIFMHCLPAHRGEEVTADVIDGPQSVIWDEAENRLHIQKAILMWCFGK